MYESALRDGLTKIFNKKYFTDYLEKEFAFADAPRRPAGADLHRHRPLQEDQRHPRPPGGRLRAGRAVAADGGPLRTEDVLARFGGEEFTVLCRGSDLRGARDRRRAAAAVARPRKFSFGGKDIPVTISLGIVAIPESGDCRPQRRSWPPRTRRSTRPSAAVAIGCVYTGRSRPLPSRASASYRARSGVGRARSASAPTVRERRGGGRDAVSEAERRRGARQRVVPRRRRGRARAGSMLA